MLRRDRKTQIPVLAAFLLLACDKDKRKKPSTDDTSPTHDTGFAPDPDPDCDTGYLDDDGECVPVACGTGTWGNLEVDESTVYVDIAAALLVTDTTIQDNAIVGVWLSGEGSYSLSDNTIHGGEGWTRETLTKCGDAVYAG